MSFLATAPEAFEPSTLSLYHVVDKRLGSNPVLVFFGPSATTNTKANSSRVQSHLFAAVGHRSFPRLTVDPTSSTYAAVSALPEEQQGSEVLRGLAFSLFKFFQELPQQVQKAVQSYAIGAGYQHDVFGASHAAELASKMVQIEDQAYIASQLKLVLQREAVSWTDVDLESITETPANPGPGHEDAALLQGSAREHPSSGSWSDIISAIGMSTFMPSSRLRRAPSHATSHSRPKTLTGLAAERILQEAQELCATELSYLRKLDELLDLLPTMGSGAGLDLAQGQAKASASPDLRLSKALDNLATINEAFRIQVEDIVSKTCDKLAGSDLDTYTKEEASHFLVALADALHELVPRFREPYRSYIELSSKFPAWISEASNKPGSSLSRGLAQLGEQRLRSRLIEPVQRLPRYSLFVDNIAKWLPSTHPALRKFLKARDMINDICAMDHDETENSLVTRRLRKLVSGWPDAKVPSGRLISVVDACEITHASELSASSEVQSGCILVMFSDYVLLLRKMEEQILSARGLLAELDRLSSRDSISTATVEAPNQSLLTFACMSELIHTQFVETCSARVIHMTAQSPLVAAQEDHLFFPDGRISKRFVLLGPYEGKVSKWTEEVARARIERRVPERLRDDASWSLRTLAPSAVGPGLLLSVFDPPMPSRLEQTDKLSYSVVLATAKQHASSIGIRRGTHYGESTVLVIQMKPEKYIVTCARDCSADIQSEQTVTLAEISSSLQRCIFRLSRVRKPSSANANDVHTYLSRMACALQSIEIRLPLQRSSSRPKIRPLSPVKALSSFLGSATKDWTSSAKGFTNDNLKALTGHSNAAAAADSMVRRTEKAEGRLKSTVNATSNGHFGSTFQHLEDTLNTYLTAINCRAGNIVGKTLRSRAYSDEVGVNELYNTLIEQPLQHRAAAEVPVDVLFCAFEKFVQNEWQSHFGPVLSAATFTSMQDLFEKPITSRLRVEFNTLLAEMSPQNRRALIAIVQLLYDLLDASGNDGDRGVITATFAEILAPPNVQGECISILDRLVEETEWLFEDYAQNGTKPSERSSRSPSRMQSVNSASIGSTGSSLRRKFGIGKLSRENSKVEPESRIGSVLRTMSKRSQNSDHESSLRSRSQIFLSRSKSTDRDRSIHGGRSPQSRPCSAGSGQLDSIQTPANTGQTRKPGPAQLIKAGSQSPTRRRRSSLSDLGMIKAVPGPLHQIEHGSKKLVHETKPSFDVNQSHYGESLSSGMNTFANTAKSSGLNTGEVSYSEVQKLLKKHPQQKSRAGGSEKITLELDNETMSSSTDFAQLHQELDSVRAQNSRGLSDQQLDVRLSRLETRMQEINESHAARLAEIQMELQRALVVSEHQRKKADKLWQETNEENEMLYERYNSELQKLFTAGQDERMQALSQKLQDATKEASRYRSETRRLRRKNAALKGEIISWQAGEGTS